MRFREPREAKIDAFGCSENLHHENPIKLIAPHSDRSDTDNPRFETQTMELVRSRNASSLTSIKRSRPSRFQKIGRDQQPRLSLSAAEIG